MGATTSTCRTPRRWSGCIYLLAAIALAVAGCAAPEPGDDTIAQNAENSTAERASLGCAVCHNAANGLDPLQLNGSGTAGKHVAHVSTKGYACEQCHAGYGTAATHLNGTLDTANPAVDLLRFGALSPDAQWTGDTGAGTGSCANAYCHGTTNTPAWYTAQTITCTNCHSAGSPIDPVAIDAGGVNGRHLMHVQTQGFACETCHQDYDLQPTHINKTLNSGKDDGTNVVLKLSSVAQSFVDWDAANNTCASSACHSGDASGRGWYTP